LRLSCISQAVYYWRAKERMHMDSVTLLLILMFVGGLVLVVLGYLSNRRVHRKG